MRKLILLCGIACSTILYSCVNKSKDQAKDIVDPNEKISKLAGVFTFTEGPAVDVNGDVYFTDQPTNRIIKWEANSKIFTTFLSNSGRSNGMYFDASGNLITCADMKGEIWSIDKDGNHTVLVDNYNGKLLNGPNDLWIAPNGAIYITDPLYKREYWTEDDPRRTESQQGGNHLYYLSPDRITLKRVDENLVKPNGIVGTPDGKTLFVADIDDTKVYQYDIQADGSLFNRQLFCEMRSDGMTIDAEGNIYLANESGVTAFDKTGKKIFNVPTAEGWTANITFGGADRKTLFITAMGSIYGLPMTVSGMK